MKYVALLKGINVGGNKVTAAGYGGSAYGRSQKV